MAAALTPVKLVSYHLPAHGRRNVAGAI